MKIIKVLLVILFTIIVFLAGFFSNKFLPRVESKNIPQPFVEKLLPLEKYSIENLSKGKVKPAKLTFEPKSEKFSMEFEPGMDGVVKKVSGRATFPESVNKVYPIVVMLRGYVDQEIYKTGIGTQKAADYFTKNGLITIAPDFLGYGEGDAEAVNIFESRFQTYTTALSLIKSLEQIPSWDGENIFIWAHSNGGQIALTVLETTGEAFPTTLWAPVTKPFPYSILYYTDESEDLGKLIRKKLSEFEESYDVENYSLTNYLDKIHAPLQLHQGTIDDAVPRAWSDTFSKKILNLDLDLNYYIYSGADHNLKPAWDSVVARDLSFFQKNLKVDKEL